MMTMMINVRRLKKFLSSTWEISYVAEWKFSCWGGQPAGWLAAAAAYYSSTQIWKCFFPLTSLKLLYKIHIKITFIFIGSSLQEVLYSAAPPPSHLCHVILERCTFSSPLDIQRSRRMIVGLDLHQPTNRSVSVGCQLLSFPPKGSNKKKEKQGLCPTFGDPPRHPPHLSMGHP